MVMLKDPDLPGIMDWSRNGPLTKAVLTRFSFLGIWNGALECHLISRQELGNDFTPLSEIMWSKSRENWKERKENETNAQVSDVFKEGETEKSEQASSLLLDGFLVPGSYSSGDMSFFTFPLKSERAGRA